MYFIVNHPLVNYKTTFTHIKRINTFYSIKILIDTYFAVKIISMEYTRSLKAN